MADEITYRFLPAEEWDRLYEIYPVEQPLPNPVVASVVVAEQAGVIKGGLFMQLAMHMEPLIINDAHVSFKHMATMLKENLPEGTPFFACIPDYHIGRMAEIMNMQPTNWTLYVGQGGE